MFELTALMIGFFGSLHCVAMCGPIALALSGGGTVQFRFVLSRLIYNLGRVTTYCSLGLIAGLAGKTLLMAGFQSSVSIGIGIFMIVIVLWNRFISGKSLTSSSFYKINSLLKAVFAKAVSEKSNLNLYFAGLANGILPCGFVYLALAGAAVTQDVAQATVYMFLFGMGTIPAMMAISIFGNLAGIKLRNQFNLLAPFMMIILALFFIYRGINIMSAGTCH
jgi:uncharacterized protein